MQAQSYFASNIIKVTIIPTSLEIIILMMIYVGGKESVDYESQGLVRAYVNQNLEKVFDELKIKGRIKTIHIPEVLKASRILRGLVVWGDHRY